MIAWPDELVNDIARRQCVIYLGSGVSKNSINKLGERPKTWKEFLTYALTKNDIKDDLRILIEKKIKNDDLLIACELLRDAFGRERYNRILKEEFQHKKFEVADIHKYIFQLDSRIVVTPNFDQIYETYAKSETEGSISVKNYYDDDLADVVRGQDRIVLKLHGTIESPDRMIFSQIDYANTRNKNQSFYQILNALITTNTFLFIGAGLNDPDIRLLLENYAFQYQWSRKHFFAVPDDLLSEQERRVYSASLNIDWLLYNSFDNHKELSDSIAALVKSVEQSRDLLSKSQNW